MRTASAQEIYESYVSSLPVPEQLRLLAMLAQRLAAEPSAVGLPVGLPRRSITELHGLGKEIWKGVDAQNYRCSANCGSFDFRLPGIPDEWHQIGSRRRTAYSGA
jgi:hypothetical protein